MELELVLDELRKSSLPETADSRIEAANRAIDCTDDIEGLEPGEEPPPPAESAVKPAPAPRAVYIHDLVHSGIDVSNWTLSQAHERSRDLQQELDTARSNLDDLIIEIEAVSAEEAKAREQAARVVRQMSADQGMQRGVLEENLRLNDQVTVLQQRLREVETRLESTDKMMKYQETVFNQLRAAEQSAKTELHNYKASTQEAISQRSINDLEKEEWQKKIAMVENEAEKSKKRNVELQARCDQLTAQCEEERKAR
jgi:chromosome segregation ATPase